MSKIFSKYLTHLFTSLFLCCLTSCTLTPKYERDESLLLNKKTYENIPAKKQNPLDQKLAANDLSNWWDHLDDTLTSKLVNKLLKQNLTLKEGAERVYQAKKAAAVQRATRLPNVEFNASGSRLKSGNENSQIPPVNYNTDLKLSWQLDLFGKLRAAQSATEAKALAAEYDLQGITQSLIAELVERRVAIYLNSRLLKLAEENSLDARKLYKSIKKRYESGVSGRSLSNLYLAKESYESSRKEIYRYRRMLASEIYRLDVLLAQAPGTISSSVLERKIALPAMIGDVGVPIDLLDRRPDLKSAEIKIIAANANIGVAVADLFPNLLISSGINYSSNSINRLFTTDNMTSSILGQITTRIFSGGSLKANIAIQESKARELSLNYANKILNAVSEVESGLKAEQEIGREYKMYKGSLSLFQRKEKQSTVRYMRGVEPFNTFLEDKKKTYNAHKALIESERELWKNRIKLYLALGGDWVKNEKKTK